MMLMRLVAVLVACVLLWAVSAPAQSLEELQNDEINVAARPSNDVQQLAKELSHARKAGDYTRARELERILFTVMPTLPADAAPLIYGGSYDMPENTAGPLWGNDVKIYTGPVWSNGKRQLAIDADTLKGIYIGINAKYQDTLSQILVYRSTNEGKNWTFLTRFYSTGQAFQSFDMCVTDTAGGKWLLGFSLVLKTDKSAAGGGHLYWGSVLSDGSDWRYKLIAPASPSTNFRNPSICTDGTIYAPGMTYHFVAAEFVNPATDVPRGLFVTRTTDWGKNWVTPDSSIKNVQESTPVIAIDWSTTPDSLCLAFTRFTTPSREIRTARNSITFSGGWTITYLVTKTDDYDPSMAIDPIRGNAIITYTRATGAPTYNDILYLYTTDLFKTFSRDSIAASTAVEELSSVSYAPWKTGYYWRVAYRSSLGLDTIYYKAIMDKLTGFYTTKPTDVSQYQPSTVIAPVVGFDRDIGGDYRGNCAYVGYGPQNVYFDAVDMALDVPIEEGVPAAYALHQNYPNPFNPTTTIKYELPKLSEVTLGVYDMLGREVSVLVNDRRDAGVHEAKFDGAGLSSGMYFYRMRVRPLESAIGRDSKSGAGNFIQTRKLLLLR